MNTTAKTIVMESTNYFSSINPECKCNNFVEYVLKIPIIQYVCNFNIDTFFLIEKKKINNKYFFIYKFIILSKKLKTTKLDYYKFFSYKKKFSKLSYKNTLEFIQIIKKILPTLTFNKLIGLFEPLHKFKLMNINLNSQEIKLSNSKNIKYDECCVCYDKTITKTSCEHYLCVECWINIKNTNECPICRYNQIKIL